VTKPNAISRRLEERLGYLKKLIRSLKRRSPHVQMIEDLHTLPQFENSIFRQLSTEAFLRVDQADTNDRVLARAFEEAGLNSNHPLHWKLLLWAFADAHFGAKAGAPKKWGPERLTQLALVVEMLRTKRPELKGDDAIATVLAKDRKFTAADGISRETLRKLIASSSDPATNLFIADPAHIEVFVAELGERVKSAGRDWSPELEQVSIELIRGLFSPDARKGGSGPEPGQK
jgi:hypothetical protein